MTGLRRGELERCMYSDLPYTVRRRWFERRNLAEVL